jgi:hypothetical protein
MVLVVLMMTTDVHARYFGTGLNDQLSGVCATLTLEK